MSRALNTAYGFFLGPAGDDGAFLFLFSAHCCRRAPVRRTQGHVVLLAQLAFDLVKWLYRKCFSGASSGRPYDAARLKRFRARWSARKAARKADPNTSAKMKLDAV